ncbi:tripartite tricarboxylate transporter substrate binding protein [Ramlibacter tataouinensis]|uniref:tripartite tricarboxylate transporter substrate binding protein n=1 Tax=Ramlibacter tataouinensis TaxID=94132 RepID=UPI0022F3DB4E|nr:tripartite tricarboxylate transporter substrate binding protein [Ramlibacter tataouinensis]WBX99917.1 tripartite tricarboxylate transporter substrate binding protein [Ramlibacter tataouinensis]
MRIVVPFTAGGPTDVLARMLAERLAVIWKQPVVVENKAGGGSTIGTNIVAKAAPDGLTIGMVVMAHVVNPAIRSDMPYDTLNDLAAVSQITSSACVLVAHPSLPANNVQELIALAKAKPGTLSYATPGIGTLNHVSGALLNQLAGIDLLHVPYGGSAAAHSDVLSGRVPLLFDVWAPVKEYVRSGKLKVLGVTLKNRLASDPGYPAIAETIPHFEVVSAFGLVTSSKVPRAIIDRIGADVASVVRDPAFAAKVRDFGMDPVGSTPQEYDRFIRAEVARWSRVVKDANIRMQ